MEERFEMRSKSREKRKRRDGKMEVRDKASREKRKGGERNGGRGPLKVRPFPRDRVEHAARLQLAADARNAAGKGGGQSRHPS
jgi:hypothetical protein